MPLIGVVVAMMELVSRLSNYFSFSPREQTLSLSLSSSFNTTLEDLSVLLWLSVH